MKQEVSSVLAARERRYEAATRLARWMGIACVAISYPWQVGINKTLFGLMVVAALFNLVRFLPWLGRSRVLTLRPLMLITDSMFAYALLALTGGTASPYLLFLTFMIISAAYWYGVVIMGLVLVADAAVVALLLMAHHSLPTPVFDPLHQAVASVVVFVSIGVYVYRLTMAERMERLQMERFNAQITSERGRLVALINSMTDAVLAVDEAGAISLYNGAALNLIDVKHSIIGKKISQTLHLYDSNKQPYDYAANIQESVNGFKRRDIIFLNRNEERMDIELTVLPYHLTVAGHRARRSYILILRDITKEKTLEDQRDEFISITSHEMRTPLAIIEANISTAMLPVFGPIGPKATAMLDTAHQNVVLLGQFLKDLSTLSKLEQGNLELDLSTVDPQALVRQVVTDYTRMATAKGLKLTVAPGNASPILTCESRIREILQNFVTNAIKYTDQGGIVIQAENAKRKNAGVVISVKDTGIGISAADKKHMFTKYFRAEDYRTRRAGGTGLGLYLTLALAERLNGKIWYTSRFNHGSTFYLQVPPFTQLAEDHPEMVAAEAKELVNVL